MMHCDPDHIGGAYSLLSAQAVRDRAHRLLALGLRDELPHFRVNLGRLDATAAAVLAGMRKNYPAGEIPIHSRWRHFMVDGRDQLDCYRRKSALVQSSRARAEFDLAVVSVLLDAGAGSRWRYRDRISGLSIGRSEGLAMASLNLFAKGLFSARLNDPLRVDAEALLRLTVADLEDGFQVTSDNPLVGIKGRTELLRQLGSLLASKPEIFARSDTARPGGLFDHLVLLSQDGTIAGTKILAELLRQFGPIWPSPITLGGVPLGDCWCHPALSTNDATSELMPLHKLSQWMT